jgi:hypothetical protein
MKVTDKTIVSMDKEFIPFQMVVILKETFKMVRGVDTGF